MDQGNFVPPPSNISFYYPSYWNKSKSTTKMTASNTKNCLIKESRCIGLDFFYSKYHIYINVYVWVKYGIVGKSWNSWRSENWLNFHIKGSRSSRWVGLNVLIPNIYIGLGYTLHIGQTLKWTKYLTLVSCLNKGSKEWV